MSSTHGVLHLSEISVYLPCLLKRYNISSKTFSNTDLRPFPCSKPSERRQVSYVYYQLESESATSRDPRNTLKIFLKVFKKFDKHFLPFYRRFRACAPSCTCRPRKINPPRWQNYLDPTSSSKDTKYSTLLAYFGEGSMQMTIFVSKASKSIKHYGQ